MPKEREQRRRRRVVEVCESPQDDQQSGLGEAELGPDDVDDPLTRVAHAVERDALPPAVGFERGHLAFGELVGAGRPPRVGTSWSMVATVRSGRRTRRFASRRLSKAWGGTSPHGRDGDRRRADRALRRRPATMCSSQIFAAMVFISASRRGLAPASEQQVELRASASLRSTPVTSLIRRRRNAAC